jgi:tetratricopeptide (TPR) repeat protein
MRATFAFAPANHCPLPVNHDGRPLAQPSRAVRLVCGLMEAIVLALVCLSPWPFGSVEPDAELALYAGVAVLLALWAVRWLLERRLTWAKCPVVLCLAALTLFGVWQLTPLPEGLLEWVAPATARTYDRLLPAQAEVLSAAEAGERTAPLGPGTISLNPGRTRQELARILAVFLLFAVVRNNTASPAALYRLSLAVTVNGALLAFFALVQFFSSSSDTVYWRYPSGGNVFGPFICRNHFAFYTNLCLGLGVGLFLCRRRPATGPVSQSHVGIGPAGSLLQNPIAVWTSGALALMLAGVACCQSRGGMLALAGGAVVCLAVACRRSGLLARPGAVLVPVGLALALVAWVGLERVGERFATVWKGQALEQSRLPLWSRTLPLAAEFPMWGTGYGTFETVEPLRRHEPADDLVYTNAENDYLEALVEGGLVRLALSLAAVALVFWLGWRAVTRPAGPGGGGLALGALFGFSTLAIHSFGDFGLHTPAIAVLATVLCAHLCALGSAPGGGPAPAGAAYTWRLGGLAPVAGAVVAVACGLVLCQAGWRAYRVYQLRHQANHLGDTPTDQRAAIACLEEAARLDPEAARLQVDIARIYMDRFMDRYKELAADLDDQNMLAEAAQAVVAPAAPMGPAQVPAWVAASVARQEHRSRAEAALVRRHLVPALRHLVRARALCPLLPEPHLYLADYGDKLPRAEARAAYLERAALLTPSHASVWFQCGQEYLAGPADRAWACWRRSLELSDVYLGPIAQQGAERLGPEGLLQQVLPKRPAILVAAALELYPDPSPKRRPFLEQALALLERQLHPLRPEDLRSKAQAHAALGQPAQAISAYRAALAQQPDQEGWHFELAGLLYRQGSLAALAEAYRELQTVVRLQPDHAAAKELLETVKRRLAASRDTGEDPQ